MTGEGRLRIFANLEKAEFLRRPNRFVVECRLRKRTVRAYLPNPGRLWELLLSGRTVYLAQGESETPRKTAYTCVAVEREAIPILLHTHHTNTAARWLLERDAVPGLEGYRVIRPEVTHGRSRFDFLLEKDGEEMLLEVKSCTLAGEEIAMFPDAVTARGARHVAELGAISRGGMRSGVLFIVHWPQARYFMPEHHTDLGFARILLGLRKDLLVKAVAVGWNRDLSLGDEVRELSIPWSLVEKESEDRGCYIIILRLSESKRISVGGLGTRLFEKGYYLYAGAAMDGLGRRIARHRSIRKKHRWHIDYLREAAEFVAGLPVRTGDPIECDIVRALEEIAGWRVEGFGSSDCACDTHLFGMAEDPRHSAEFIRLLQHFRIDRLMEKIETLK